MGVSGKEAKETEVKGEHILAQGTTWNQRVETGQVKDTHQPGPKPEGPKTWHCWRTWDLGGGGWLGFGTSLTLFLTSLWPLNSR